jgi:hypothetical protein
MIRALELENFKGFSARQRIEFAPITLLFGANSAGKSTVFQAVLYLHEILERGTADVGRTELGGHIVQLGGFERLVHGHALKRPIVLRVEFATSGSLDRFGRELADFPFPDLDDELEAAWLELTIRHRQVVGMMYEGPVVERAVIGVGSDSEPLVSLETGPTLADGEPVRVRVNLGHPIIAEQAREIADAWEELAIPRDVPHVAAGDGSNDPASSAVDEAAARADRRLAPVFALPRTRMSALPQVHEPLRLLLPGATVEQREEAFQASAPRPTLEETRRVGFAETVRARERALLHVQTFLEMVVLGTTAQLVGALRDSLYIGPLRAVPTQGSLFARPGRRTSWANGLAAWEALLSDWELLDPTNEWLRRLGTGCKVLWQELFDPLAEEPATVQGHVDAVVRRLLLETGGGAFVHPSEVGAGISQVMPVIVAAVQKRGGVTLIEQPEIHVHPALQVGLGDLFIEAANRDGARRILLVETHSEHLILRLLRRIRETTEKELPERAPAFSEDKLSVIHVKNSGDGVRASRLRVDSTGEFVDRWPDGFFDERAEELF